MNLKILLNNVAVISKELGILDEIKYRNKLIQIDFNEMRNNGTTAEEAIEKLIDKYNLSYERIKGIIYLDETIEEMKIMRHKNRKAIRRI